MRGAATSFVKMLIVLSFENLNICCFSGFCIFEGNTVVTIIRNTFSLKLVAGEADAVAAALLVAQVSVVLILSVALVLRKEAEIFKTIAF